MAASPGWGGAVSPQVARRLRFGKGFGADDEPVPTYDMVLCLRLHELSRDGAEPDADEAERLRERRRVYSACRRAGLQLRARVSSDGRSLFVLVGAPPPLFERVAEAIGLDKRLRPEFGDSLAPARAAAPYADYRRSRRTAFAASADGQFFTSLERQRMLARVLEADTSGRTRVRGAGLDLDGLVEARVLRSHFVLEGPAEAHALRQAWAWQRLGAPPPLDDIRAYFGEQLGFYAAWAHVYGVALAALALPAGAAQAADWLLREGGGAEGARRAALVTGAYSVLVALWSALFIEAWKRRRAELAFAWNVKHAWRADEATRPEFLRARLPGGRELPTAPGVYTSRGLAPLGDEEDDDPRRAGARRRARDGAGPGGGGGGGGRGAAAVRVDLAAAPAPRALPFLPVGIRRRRLAASAVITLSGVVALAVGTVALAAFKLILAAMPATSRTVGGVGGVPAVPLGLLLGAILNALFVQAMGALWGWAGAALTRRETHRTDSGYEDSLAAKTFAFLFVNNFASLFYIAYVQAAKLHLFGLSHPQHGGPLVDECPGGDCMRALRVQLAALVITKQLARHLTDAARHCLAGWRRSRAYRLASRARGTALDHALGEQAARAPFGGTFHELAEMGVQLGLVTLFAAALPGGAVLCWAGNLFERRSDAARLLSGVQRPRARPAAGIGSVGAIMELMAAAAVITNCLTLYLASEHTRELLRGALGDDEAVLLSVVLLEHLILGARLLLALCVPDEPRWVERTRVRVRAQLESIDPAAARGRPRAAPRRTWVRPAARNGAAHRSPPLGRGGETPRCARDVLAPACGRSEGAGAPAREGANGARPPAQQRQAGARQRRAACGAEHAAVRGANGAARPTPERSLAAVAPRNGAGGAIGASDDGSEGSDTDGDEFGFLRSRRPASARARPAREEPARASGPLPGASSADDDSAAPQSRPSRGRGGRPRPAQPPQPPPRQTAPAARRAPPRAGGGGPSPASAARSPRQGPAAAGRSGRPAPVAGGASSPSAGSAAGARCSSPGRHSGGAPPQRCYRM